MAKITITVDSNADQKVLRRLQRAGVVELHVMNIENAVKSKKISRKHMPLAVFDSPHSTFGNCVIAANDSLWPEISREMTKSNHGDALQLDGHIRSGRDILVTDDKDLLARRDDLAEKFCVKIKSTPEIVEMFELSNEDSTSFRPNFLSRFFRRKNNCD